MLRPIDHYFSEQDEPAKTCLQFLRTHILQLNSLITEEWKYGMPFYCLHKKRFCYLWTHKKFRKPYIGIVNGQHMQHPDLIPEARKKMKILLLDPTKNLPIKKIDGILKAAMALANK